MNNNIVLASNVVVIFRHSTPPTGKFTTFKLLSDEGHENCSLRQVHFSHVHKTYMNVLVLKPLPSQHHTSIKLYIP